VPFVFAEHFVIFGVNEGKFSFVKGMQRKGYP
jgi:hypothetical protein